jgi:hypothetical protein
MTCAAGVSSSNAHVLIERSSRRDAAVNVHVEKATSISHIAATELVLELDCARLVLPARVVADQSSIRRDTSNAATLQLALDRGQIARLRAPSIATLDGQLAPLPELTALMCRTCAMTVVNGSTWRRVLPLPSAAWLELTDLWHCRCSHAHMPDGDESHDPHEHGDAHSCATPSHHARPEHKRIAAQSDLLLVDSSTLLIHTSNLIADAVVVNRADAVAHCFGVELAHDERANVALQCARCSTVLGYVLDNGASDLLDNNDARIFTRRITALSQHYAVRRLLAASVECDVAEDLAFHVKQTQQRRFIVHRRGATATLLVLVLHVEWMSWLAILDTSDSEEIELEGQLRAHVKLAYRVCEPDIDCALEIERWRSELRAQTLEYDASVCDELMRVLHVYNSQLPSSQRALDGLKVAALKRASL